MAKLGEVGEEVSKLEMLQKAVSNRLDPSFLEGSTLIISGIYSNLEALNAVLQELADLFTNVLCVGNVLGLGPSPNEVIERLMGLQKELSEKGGTLRIIASPLDLECLERSSNETDLVQQKMFNRAEAETIIWTQMELKPENRSWLSRKIKSKTDEAIVFLENDALFATTGVGELRLSATPGKIDYNEEFVGGKPAPVFIVGGREIEGEQTVGNKKLVLLPSTGFLGSFDVKANAILFDAKARSFTSHSISYDFSETVKRITRIPIALISKNTRTYYLLPKSLK